MALEISSLWAKWRPRLSFFWGGITAVVAPAIVGIVFLVNNKDAFDKIYNLISGHPWTQSAPVVATAPTVTPTAKKPALVLEDAPPPDGGAELYSDSFARGDTMTTVYGRNVSNKPKLVFEEANGGKVRLLLTNDTGRKIYVASAQIINGKPDYLQGRPPKKRKDNIPVYVPPTINYRLTQCVDKGAPFQPGEVSQLELCPSAKMKEFTNYIPNSSSSDELYCALDVHFITSEGEKVHAFMKMWCFDLENGFAR